MNQTIALRTRVDEITSLPLLEAIPALLDLTNRLTTVLSPEGQRLIIHPDYTDSAELNHLARFYLDCGQRCTDERAPFRLRLDHLELDDRFYAYYEQTNNAIKEAISTGAISRPCREYEGACCAHCAWEPAAVIPGGDAQEEALYFEEDEYQAYWGDAENIGAKYFGNREKSQLKASREQVEEAMRRLQVPN